MAVHVLYEVDLSMADLEVFERYAERALRLLAEHGGVRAYRARDVTNLIEWHLIRMPDDAHWTAFRNDPRRQDVQWLLDRSKVRVIRYHVTCLP